MKLRISKFALCDSFLLFFLLTVLALSAGCGGGVFNNNASITSIAVTPASPSIAAGVTQQFSAMATYSNGTTADVTSLATWTSSTASVASISSGGMATAVAAGSSTITASLSGVSSAAALTVTAAVKTVSSIAVTPATASITAGATQQFTATATYSDGSTANVTSSAMWNSSSTAAATINAAGLATSVAAGSSTITATLSGVSGTAALTVAAAVKTLSSIAVTPATASIVAGTTQQFTATATYSDGSNANITSSVTWSSSSTAAATINAAGLATGVAAGATTITASLSGVSGTATLTVTAVAKTLSSIAVTPATASIVAGGTQQFTATATYGDGSTANISSSATWTSSSTAAATINATGMATCVAAGTTTITASLSGVSGTGSLTVTAKTLTSITVTPAAPSIGIGATQQFTATATYSDNSTTNITSSVTWTSSSTATATINAAGLATPVAQGSSTITATSGSVSGTSALTVTAKSISSIAVTPNPASFATGSTQQFTATATYSDNSTADISSTVTWTVANTAVATIDASGLATGQASGQTTVSAAQSGVTGNATTTVTLVSGSGMNVPMWHVDSSRTGLNPNETSLTPSNVSAQTFGKLFSYQIDGYAYAAPLIMSNITINGAAHNVMYVATEHDTVYAFDADNYGTGTPLWQTSLLQTSETPMTDGPIQPYQGVTSTPVIDTSTNTIYVVSAQTLSGNATFRLNALDITTGLPKYGSPVTVTAEVYGTNTDAGKNGDEDKLTTSCVQRAALLVANSNVYIAFGGCHSGWLLSYNETTLAQTGMFDMSPDYDGEGAYASAGGVWMGGGGPIVDANGNIFIVTGNGPFDRVTVPTTSPSNPTSPPATPSGAWADSVLKFNKTPSNGMLVLDDYFTPADYQFMDCNDSDLASGGLLMVPSLSGAPGPQFVTGGKMGKLYFLNAANLGKENGPPNTSTTGTNSSLTTDSGALQTLEWGAAAPGQSSPLVQDYLTNPGCTDSSGTNVAVINPFEIFGTSAYFNNSIYLGITPTGSNVPSGIRQFTYTGGSWVPGAYTSQYTQQNTRGTTPFVSANGTSNGILWMIDQGLPLQNTGGTPTAATLRAYDATNLANELYNSSTNSADVPGYGIKFTSPVVANGKAYVSTGHDLTTVTNPKGEIDVYGLN